MFGIGPSEMVLVMLVALLLFGGDLPKVARSWGKSIAEFKRGLSTIQNEFNSVIYDEPRRVPYHDPVYSHNAGTIDGHLAADDAAHDQSHAPEAEAIAAEQAPHSADQTATPADASEHTVETST